ARRARRLRVRRHGRSRRPRRRGRMVDAARAPPLTPGVNVAGARRDDRVIMAAMRKRVILDLLVAVGTVALATVVKASLVDPVVDIKDPFALYIAAVTLTAWRGWRWAALSI